MTIVRTNCRLYIFLSAFLLLGMIGCEKSQSGFVVPTTPLVMVSHPVEREVTDYEIFTARTQAVQSVDIKPRVTGFLTKILFKDGDTVKKGDLLFEIDDRTYKANLDQAKASLELSQAALVKNQADYDIGLTVQKQNKGAISEQELVRRLGSRDESKASVDKSKADIELAQLYYDWCKITSPIDGRISRHLVDEGNLVTEQMTTLTNIVSLKPIWAYFDVDQNTAQHYQNLVAEGKIKSPRKSEIPVQMGVGESKDFPISGAVDFINNQLDPNTGSIRLRAKFANEDGKLLSGLFTRIQLPLTLPHPALLVVDSAVGTNQGQRYVLVVNDQNEVEYRIVEVGQMHDSLREVKTHRTITQTGADGKDVAKQVEVLKPTDKIIVEGLLRVRPGIKVEAKLVDMQTLLNSPGTAPETKPEKSAK